MGKARQYNRRFLQMCSHHLVEPVACTPASGWEKGQVENQVGTLRDLLFRPKPRVSSLVELNGWLADQCIRAHAPAGPFNQLSYQRCQVPGIEGSGQFHVRRYNGR